LGAKVLSAKLLKTGASVQVKQDEFRTHLVGMPEEAPDAPVTTIVLECDKEPTQNTDRVRINRPRLGVGV
jgi:alpha-L-fucosidase